jgi:hypothetical protein
MSGPSESDLSADTNAEDWAEAERRCPFAFCPVFGRKAKNSLSGPYQSVPLGASSWIGLPSR